MPDGQQSPSGQHDAWPVAATVGFDAQDANIEPKMPKTATINNLLVMSLHSIEFHNRHSVNAAAQDAYGRVDRVSKISRETTQSR